MIMNDTRRTKIFIVAMTLAALSTAAYAGLVDHAFHAYLAAAILTSALATSRMKVKLPGINSNMSVNLPFLLAAIVALSAAEASTIALISTAAQCWPRRHAKLNPRQMTFNVSMMVFASASATMIIHSSLLHGLQVHSITFELLLATATLFLGQTVPVAGIVAVSEQKSASSVWWKIAHLAFPYYVVSAGVTTMVEVMSSHLGWGLTLAVLPVMYGIHRSYKVYFGQLSETLSTAPIAKAAGAGA
jgi:hypothetical protein